MIKGFVFENYKSFEKAVLNLESITSLIGTNSSGKSNAIEGIQILSEAATGLDLSVILDGTRNNASHIRGGSSSCCRFRKASFKLGCLVNLDENHDLYYFIRISTNKRVWVEEEALYKVLNGNLNLGEGEKIFKTKKANKDSGDIKAEYNNKKRGNNPDIICMRVSSVLAQLKSKLPQETEHDQICLSYINLMLDNLKGIFVLNPIPSVMRDYVRSTDIELKPNCENISPVLYHLCQNEKKRNELLSTVRNLPENEVQSIEFIKTQLDDVIFGLKEKYMNNSEIVDAKKLSDGTLRCIGILAAILSIPKGGMLVVEEIDNGIHPGRVYALIDTLEKIGKERNVDIILTTHNPTLLNGYDKNKLLGVTVVYREAEKGTSLFVSLIDIEQSPELFAAGGIGDAMTDNTLIKMIKEPRRIPDTSWLGV